MQLDTKEFLQRYLLVSTITDGNIGQLNANDAFDSSILKQLQECNATLPLCHIQLASEFIDIMPDALARITNGATHFVWDLPSWRECNPRYTKRKLDAEIARRTSQRIGRIVNHISSALAVAMPSLDDKSRNALAEQFTKDREKEIMQPIFKMYGIDIKSIEEQSIIEPLIDTTVQTQKQIDEEIEARIMVKIQTVTVELQKLISQGHKQNSLVDYIRLNGYSAIENRVEIVRVIEKAEK